MSANLRKKMARFLSAICLVFLSLTNHAADLHIGYKTEVTSADPHVLFGNNRNIWGHVYETLVFQNATLQATPGLATGWRSIDAHTWAFDIRPNVRFHNGALLSAEDVKYSLERAMQLKGARTFRNYLKDISAVTVSGPLRIEIKTVRPAPTLPDNIGLIAIMLRSNKPLSEEDFASGKSATGTGPYKFREWKHGQQISFEKNTDYWGAHEPWTQVTFHFLPKDAARAAALLSGSVDLIDSASSTMAGIFKNTDKIDTTSTTSYMLQYLRLDLTRDDSPYIKSADQHVLKKNPLLDQRVRQAMCLAIDRPGLVKMIMKGDAEAASQLVPEKFFGFNGSLTVPAHDTTTARALLRAAGYPRGFQISLHCSNDRYLNDAKLCEAIGQLLTQIGIKTEVRTLPFAVFATRSINGGTGGTPEFSLSMIGQGAVTGDALPSLTTLAHSMDRARGYGANNITGYSNNELDELIEQASLTMDNDQRAATVQRAARLLYDDVGVIPLLFPKSIWAYKKELHFTPRSDGFTYAMNVRVSEKK
ncbi:MULTISPECIES: ABC transporter substrate-binding protein [unclassified Undibacterium]|uniref:ABC transporter substrate-binding protein n=1 Tax=unclassified Undibacterium TaxID=2630295 RepID=UPI002AC9B55A|nr:MULTISPECIES: ABC transporter substrate-binding protein [unclassified Undibacterium]MEB0138306.1 ABC transporter substrate-binding protein [Undibacterium sp. CCC2.1]MEB0170792.1 ABC transporter substrate-binding protein [Undibacterium sp. CCC1.1]MEB0174681.1 ABC transporter substrate-binding protein [Undibacterium sp. CCC3.4]MEB0213878.1 ABC transporter substrate-binding protein [Undibacterium sp. 5I2]WPX42604.1 ABC transporter substrate-binding protein [Undibacterium sp. CCC3.4]